MNYAAVGCLKWISAGYADYVRGVVLVVRPMIKKFSDAWKVCNTKYDWFYCRKLPVVIKAIQMDKDFEVETLEGNHKGKAGDFLLQGVNYEVYPCKKEIFEKTYMKVK